MPRPTSPVAKPEALLQEILKRFSADELLKKDQDKLLAEIERFCLACRGSGHKPGYYLNRVKGFLDNTALMGAVIQGKPEIVKALLKAGADPNVPGGGVYSFPVGYGCDNAVTRLFQSFIDDSVPEPFFTPPLSALLEAQIDASLKSWPEIARLLLEAGAKPDATNTDGRTALMQTCLLSQKSPKEALPMAAFLLKAGADPLLTSKTGDHALVWAMTKAGSNGTEVSERPSLAMVKLLLPTMTARSSHRAKTGIWAGNDNGHTLFEVLWHDASVLSGKMQRELVSCLLSAMFSPASWQGATLAELEGEWAKLPSRWRALGAQAMLETRRTLSPLLARPRLSPSMTP